MAQVIKTTFQLRRGNLEVWERNNPILAKGEPSFVVDKNALKIGDGVTPWKELEFIGINQDDLSKAIEDYFKENPGAGSGGRGIVSIERTSGDGSPGSQDVYTILYTDNTTSSFTVYNGKDGVGATEDCDIFIVTIGEEDNATPSYYYADKTVEEIAEAAWKGKAVFCKHWFTHTVVPLLTITETEAVFSNVIGIPEGDKDQAYLVTVTVDNEKVDILIDKLEPGSNFIVNITRNESDVYVSDKTYEEVFTAIKSGRNVMAKLEDFLFPLSFFDNNSIAFIHTLITPSKDSYVDDSFSITISLTPEGVEVHNKSFSFYGEVDLRIEEQLTEAKENGDFNGKDGRGIVSISKTDGTGAPGTYDTYTITYTDLTTSTFTVYNGKDGEDGKDGASFWIATFPIDWSINQLAECEISGIQIPVSRELKEYDLILGIDGNVGIVRWVREGKVGIRRSQVLLKGQPGQDGRGITSILKTSGDGTPGSTDTYTISYGENSTSTFTVYNGKDGKDGSATEGEQRKPQVFQTTSFDLLPTTDVYIGDFGIVKTQIVDGKNSHTAFIYTENGWAALDGNYNANNVYFDEDLLVTTKIGTIQTLTNGQAVLPARGKTLKQVFSSLIAKRKAPTATLPSGTIEWTNYENGNYLVEVGETITPTWKTTFSAGSYTYGPSTGITATQAKVYLSTNSNSSSTISAGEMNGKTGSLSALTINDTSTKHYAKVEYGWTDGTSIPKDNFGDDYINTSNNLPIQAASGKTDTSTYYIQGYRKAFFGSRVSPIELTSHNIRSLADNTNSSNANFTVTIDQGATQVVIAVPQGRVVKKVEDNGAFGQDILEAFDKYTDSSTINVGGADATSSNIGNYSAKYNVYVYNPSTPLGSNTYTVILGNE